MTQGMNQEGLLALADYHAYATKKMLETVEKLGESKLSQEENLSHGTIRRMLQHMMGTETYFLAVCQGHSLDFDPTRYDRLEEIRAYWDGLEHRMRRYIEKVEKEELERAREFQLHDSAYDLPAWKLLVYAFMHATHHRGELSVLLNELGEPLPTIDILTHILQTDHPLSK